MGLQDAVNKAESMNLQQAREQMLAKIAEEENQQAQPQAQAVEPVPPVVEPTQPAQGENQTLAPEPDVAQQAQQIESDVTSVLAENEALKAELERLKIIQKETSNQKTIDIVEEILAPPVLDIHSLIYADEETVKAKQEEYSKQLAEYSEKAATKKAMEKAMEKYEPILQKYENDKKQIETENTINALADMEDFKDIKQYIPQISNILTNNKAVASMDNVEEKLVTAYAIAKGISSMNKKGPSQDEFMNLYESNKEFQDAIEKKRLERLTNQQVPPLSASTGASSAALNIPKRPMTLDEASAFLRKQN